MRATISMILAAAIGLGAIGLSGCFDDAYEHGWGPARQAHEEREFNYGPQHEVCDSYGNHCMICDRDGDYCRRLSSNGWDSYSHGDGWTPSYHGYGY